MGQHKSIKSPEYLWELFKEYELDVESRPFLVQDFVGKDGNEVQRKRQRCLSVEGFEDFLFEKGIINDLGDYMSNKEGRYSDFIDICKAIRRRCRRDQIEGGMAGIYNHSITARLNGLVDKVQEDGTKEVLIKVKYERKNNLITGASPSTDGSADGGEAV